MISPYFIPGDEGMARIRAARARGIRITVVTNSLADSDEPLVNVNYNRYRVAMLQEGVELLEVSTRSSSAARRCAACCARRAGGCMPSWP